MARIYPLFSSSKGNATYIGNEKSGILIDIGVSTKRLVQALNSFEIDPSAIKAIFITHEHSDHIKGLPVFTKKYNVPIITQQITMNNLIDKNQIPKGSTICTIDQSPITAADFEIRAFSTPHDTEQSCGFMVKTNDDKKVCVCTDLGHITEEVESNLLGSDLVLLESNYDKKMLREGPYPYYLKRRIDASTGHLSNEDCANQIKRLIACGTKRFILGHLSQENNLPRVAEMATLAMLTEYERNSDYTLDIAPVETNGQMVVF